MTTKNGIWIAALFEFLKEHGPKLQLYPGIYPSELEDLPAEQVEEAYAGAIEEGFVLVLLVGTPTDLSLLVFDEIEQVEGASAWYDIGVHQGFSLTHDLWAMLTTVVPELYIHDFRPGGVVDVVHVPMPFPLPQVEDDEVTVDATVSASASAAAHSSADTEDDPDATKEF